MLYIYVCTHAYVSTHACTHTQNIKKSIIIEAE